MCVCVCVCSDAAEVCWLTRVDGVIHKELYLCEDDSSPMKTLFLQRPAAINHGSASSIHNQCPACVCVCLYIYTHTHTLCIWAAPINRWTRHKHTKPLFLHLLWAYWLSIKAESSGRVSSSTRGKGGGLWVVSFSRKSESLKESL